MFLSAPARQADGCSHRARGDFEPLGTLAPGDHHGYRPGLHRVAGGERVPPLPEPALPVVVGSPLPGGGILQPVVTNNCFDETPSRQSACSDVLWSVFLFPHHHQPPTTPPKV